jgi:hypothetical protein
MSLQNQQASKCKNDTKKNKIIQMMCFFTCDVLMWSMYDLHYKQICEIIMM